MIKEDTVRIHDLIRESVPFTNWSLQDKQILSLAIFPTDLRDGEGRWSEEGRHGLNLLRHLIKACNFVRAPIELQQPSLDLDEATKTSLAERVYHVRRELVAVVPPWTFTLK
ncbi:hypothetical protein ACKF11_13505 [Methylobacillus sp. Pita2]|uniref:hypothetical protein n=1 Tax=Methylobacillus sp. Pita2 TaxID=3383245 RepID=UPI0038B643CD